MRFIKSNLLGYFACSLIVVLLVLIISKCDTNPVGSFDKQDIDNFNHKNHHERSLWIDEIYTILLDTKNVLWIGGRVGIVKYDGTNWTLYDAENSNLPINVTSSTMNSIDARSIKQNTNSDIYAVCFFGLRKYYKGNWEKIASEWGDDILMLSCIDFDQNSDFILGARRYVYKNISGVWSRIIIGDDDALKIKLDNENKIWASLRYNIISVDNDTFAVHYSFPDTMIQYPNSNAWTNHRILAFDIDSKNHVWATSKYELVQYDGQKWQKHNYENSLLPYLGINGFIIDANDNIWVYGKGGIWIYNNNTWNEYKYDDLNIPDEITLLYVDSEQNCWIVSNSKLFLRKVSRFL